MFGKRRRAASNPVGALSVCAQTSWRAPQAYGDAMLTNVAHAAPASPSAQRIRLARRLQGLHQECRIQRRPLVGCCRRRPAHPRHDADSRRRHSHEAHGPPRLALVKRQHLATTARPPAPAVELRIHDGALLSRAITRRRKSSGCRCAAGSANAKERAAAGQRRSPACVQPRAYVPWRITRARRQRQRRQPG